MKNYFYIAVIFLFLQNFFSGCNGQIVKKEPLKIDRQPAVAGAFYPSDQNQLLEMLKGFFKQAPDNSATRPLAIIVPHAGYIYSGGVAASGYKQIDPDRKFKHIFVIGSSHTMYFNGASIYSIGDYITPLGKVTVDTLSGWLVDHYKIFSNSVEPHLKEHSIEVQLPFLQYWLKKPFTIIPIILGGGSQSTSKQVAEALKPFFNSDNLFIISTDFSHYPDYSDSQFSDSVMAHAVVSNSSKNFLKAKYNMENKGIPNLVTAMCGWTSTLALLDITEGQSDIGYKIIEHKNSGDSEVGDKERVVGYCAIEALKKPDKKTNMDFSLSDGEKKKLLVIARNTITGYITTGKTPNIDEKSLPPNLLVHSGAFVTLTKNGNLRGCIGNFQPDGPLYATVQSMAIAAATQDYRFNKVTKDELKNIELEISVLTPMHKINSIDEIVLGRDGIYIKKGNKAGTFLPQVATETGWDKEEFLGHCAQDKAFIGWDGWKTADIFTYQALVFNEKELGIKPNIK